MADEQKITQADVDKAVKDAVAAAKTEMQETFEAETEGLKNKNKELLTKLREASGVKPEDLAAVEQELTQAKADLAEANKQVKTLTTERDKAVSSLEAEQAVTHKLVAENGVIKALSDAGVSDPAYLEAAKAMHLPNVKVVAEGEDRKALYGDKDIAEAIKEWAGGDVGKKFVSAPDNSGGGAPGGKGGGSEKTMTRAEYNEKIVSDPKGTNAFLKEGGRIVDQAA